MTYEVVIDIVESRRCTVRVNANMPREALEKTKKMLNDGTLDSHMQLVSSKTELALKPSEF